MNERSTRVGVVLSAGGLRGAAHVGVLRALVRAGVEVDVIVGASAGAVIAGYYGCAGLTLDELAADAVRFRGRHLLAHSINIQSRRRFARFLDARCGIIPDRLEQLDAAHLEHLHHGIAQIGIVCHDVIADRPRYFATGADHGVALGDLVRASASIPLLFPHLAVTTRAGDRWLLTDGGVSDPVPILFARELGATHVVVSDCRWIGTRPPVDDRTVWIRPRMPGTGTLWTRRGLAAAVAGGEAAVNGDALATICDWARRPHLRTAGAR
jgi:NTE family protein